MTRAQFSAIYAAADLPSTPNEAQRQAQFDLFDRICDAQGIEPQQLVKTPGDALLAWITSQLPNEGKAKGVPIDTARAGLKQYIKACEEASAQG